MGRRATAVVAAGSFSAAGLVAIACSSVAAHTSGGGAGTEESVVAVYPLCGDAGRLAVERDQLPRHRVRTSCAGPVSVRRAGVTPAGCRAHSDGMGASFVPRKRFKSG